MVSENLWPNHLETLKIIRKPMVLIMTGGSPCKVAPVKSDQGLHGLNSSTRVTVCPGPNHTVMLVCRGGATWSRPSLCWCHKDVWVGPAGCGHPNSMSWKPICIGGLWGGGGDVFKCNICLTFVLLRIIIKQVEMLCEELGKAIALRHCVRKSRNWKPYHVFTTPNVSCVCLSAPSDSAPIIPLYGRIQKCHVHSALHVKCSVYILCSE